ncbi:MAG: hypothetical protein ACM3JI_02755, partial [Anaerolineae bacterium]
MVSLQVYRLLEFFKTAAISALLLLACLHSSFAQAQPKSFAIVISSQSCKEWDESTFESVLVQSYDRFRLIYIDNHISEITKNFVRASIENSPLKDRATFIFNENPLSHPLENLQQAIQGCSPHEIVVLLEEGDYFADRNVLSHLNEIYANPNVWLTYAQVVDYPTYKKSLTAEIPQEILKQNAFRSYQCDPLIFPTFYAGLFHQIKKEDLFYPGESFSAADRQAITLPLLEMAGLHSRFIPQVSYIRNSLVNPASFLEEKEYVESYLRSQEKYLPLHHYFRKKPSEKIYITPGFWGQLFAIDNPVFNRDNCLDVLYRLRDAAEEKGYLLEQADSVENLGEFKYLIVFDIFLDTLSYLKHYPKEKLILFLWEPPTVAPQNYNPEYHRHFSKVYTWNDDLVDNKKYFKFHYPVCQPMIKNPIDFYWKRLSTLIASNKTSSYTEELYTEREKLIDFFETSHRDDFDLFGKGWPRSYKTYQGTVEKKVDCLKHYKFGFAYENSKHLRGYVTEKIFDC